MKRTRAMNARPIRRMLGVGLVFAGLALASCSKQAPTDSAVPHDVRVFDLAGNSIDPFGSEKPLATAFLFVATDCPISNRYAPEITRLSNLFAPDGVDLRLIYADATDLAPKVQKHLEEYALPGPAYLDREHLLVKLCGATITPEVAVFDRDDRLVYRGRIDDRYVDFGVERRASASHDLERVLSALVAGEELLFESTKAVGCFIPDLD